MLDGGPRLLGRVLPIGRGGRLALVSLAALAFLAGTIALAGMQIAQQAGNFQEVITSQANRALEWAASFGFVPSSIQVEQILEQVMGSLRSEEHTSELQLLMRISYAVFSWKKQNLCLISVYLYFDSQY